MVNCKREKCYFAGGDAWSRVLMRRLRAGKTFLRRTYVSSQDIRLFAGHTSLRRTYVSSQDIRTWNEQFDRQSTERGKCSPSSARYHWKQVMTSNEQRSDINISQSPRRISLLKLFHSSKHRTRKDERLHKSYSLSDLSSSIFRNRYEALHSYRSDIRLRFCDRQSHVRVQH